MPDYTNLLNSKMFSPANAVQYYARDNLLENAKNYFLPCYVDLLLFFFCMGSVNMQKCSSHRNRLNYVPKKDEKVYFNCG